MKKANRELLFDNTTSLVIWDLDGTLIDSEIVWYRMNEIIVERFGADLSDDERSTAQEKIASEMYLTIPYRANAEKVLHAIKQHNIIEVIVNACALTNDAMYRNPQITKGFPFDLFDCVVSERDFDNSPDKKAMYKRAMETVEVTDAETVIVFEDLPDDLEQAKALGMTTVWVCNSAYPFTEEELAKIEKYADYYVEDFLDLL